MGHINNIVYLHAAAVFIKIMLYLPCVNTHGGRAIGGVVQEAAFAAFFENHGTGDAASAVNHHLVRLYAKLCLGAGKSGDLAFVIAYTAHLILKAVKTVSGKLQTVLAVAAVVVYAAY